MKKLITLACCLPLLMAACGGGDEDRTAPTATLENSGSIKDPAPPGTAIAVATSTPRSGGAAVNSEPFTFQSTADGMTMKGHLYSVTGPKRKVVILAHGENDDQKAWQTFAQELALKGIAAVTFDFRGYGETGGAKDTSRIATDLTVAVRYLKSLDWPLIYIAGSDIGGTAALKVAATEELAGVATISSLASVTGLNATADIPQIVEPKLFLAASGDGPAATAVLSMATAATEPKMSRTVEGTSARGTALLQVEAARQALLTFIGQP